MKLCLLNLLIGLEVLGRFEGIWANPTTNSSIIQKPCRVENGLSSIIVDIAESINEQTNQTTFPRELPVVGKIPQEIDLALIYSPQQSNYFKLNEKQLQLNQILDRDENDISSIVFQAVCGVKATGEKRTIPIIVRVSDLNDNVPNFTESNYEISVPESTPVGTIIFRDIKATDLDAGVNGLVEYSIGQIDPEDFSGFAIESPHLGIVSLNSTLDYERHPRLLVTILASDRAFDPSLRKTATSTLTVNVLDSDDLGPTFVQNGCVQVDNACVDVEYNATVVRGILSGILDVLPERIQAVDSDSLGALIRYNFVTGSPATFLDYFVIDSGTGIIRQVRPVLDDTEIEFNVIVKATEVTEAKRFTTTRLNIKVLAQDKHRPIIHSTGLVGYVPENSPIGTLVLVQGSQQPIKFKITDDDLAPHDVKPIYQYELTTSAFRVNEEGILVVAVEELDRDPPRPPQLHFQIIARELGHGFSSSSSPIVILVKLQDVNDNSPLILPMSPVTIPGGDGKRSIIKVEAIDRDEGEHAQIRFSLSHISNNGKEKFSIDPVTGILESVGLLKSGEVYSVTVQATDGGGKSFQSIVEVKVIDGENLKPPLFLQFAYDVSVAEGTNIGAEVMTMEARDPEGKSVVYEIINGNDLHHFTIGKESGIIRVNADLDREDLSRYSLLIKAEDEGKLFSTAQVNVKILDNDDNNPILIGTPYEFNVKEGLSEKYIGRVLGKDMDEGENALIRYEVPDDAPIRVDPETGDIYTKKGGLDYEAEKTHFVVLTAKGKTKESRIATATVTIHVEDDGDEMPVFRQFTYEVNIRENSPNMKILHVEAVDPDTMEKRITYYIKQGPYDKFSIDPVTGDIYATQILDYEEASRHILIVGTEENDSGNVGSTTTVVINVIDENDIPPIFSVIPRPIRLDDTAHVGFVLTQLQAVDSDGTSPGNKVKYELVGRGKSYRYFEIHPDTGVLTIKDDLRKEMDTEYQLDIRAYDLGEPSLDSMATVKIYVDHVATVPPDIGVGFADTDYTVEISENSPAGKSIKELVIVNKPDELIPISCDILSGNEEKLFEVSTTSERNCLLSLVRPNLDFERIKKYELNVHLVTLPGVISKKRSHSIVKVKILDENDNKAEFIVPEYQRVGRGKKIFVAIPETAQIGVTVTQIQARDADSGSYGEVMYDLESENQIGAEYFQLDRKSGLLTTARTPDTASPSILPFRLTVRARDNPSGPGPSTSSSTLDLIVNVINSAHRMVIVMEGIQPESAKTKEIEILRIIQEMSNLVIGIEKMSVHQFFHSNGTSDVEPSVTDVWFYAVDPITDHILDRENPKVSEGILGQEESKKIGYFISSKLSVRVREIRKPIVRPPLAPGQLGPLQAEQQWAPFPAALIALASIIFVVTLISISLVCYKWSRYAAYKNQVQRFVVSPRYEPFYVENSRSPSLKQYETQVLKMKVNADEGDTSSDLQVDLNLNRNHTYAGARTVPNLSLTEGNSSIRPNGAMNYSNIGSMRAPTLQTFHGQQTQAADLRDPSMANPIYQRSDDDDYDDEDGIVSIASESNENVHFQQSRDNLVTKTTNHHNRRSLL